MRGTGMVVAIYTNIYRTSDSSFKFPDISEVRSKVFPDSKLTREQFNDLICVCRVDDIIRRRGACLAQEDRKTLYGILRLNRVMYRRRLVQRYQGIPLVKCRVEAWKLHRL